MSNESTDLKNIELYDEMIDGLVDNSSDISFEFGDMEAYVHYSLDPKFLITYMFIIQKKEKIRSQFLIKQNSANIINFMPWINKLKLNVKFTRSKVSELWQNSI